MSNFIGKTVEHDGETWTIIGVGAARDDGKVYLHLSSTTRGRQQKNGWTPSQIADWVDLNKIEGA